MFERCEYVRGNCVAALVNMENDMTLGKWSIHPVFALFFVLLAGCGSEAAQQKEPMVRLSKLVIEAAQLEAYKSALKEEVTASVRLEPGVLTLYAVSEKDRPTHITILEIYADRAAYEQHIESPHFLKYKTGTEHMVESLELIDTFPLVPDMKIK
jgi:quinol monooxygenase YgiN